MYIHGMHYSIQAGSVEENSTTVYMYVYIYLGIPILIFNTVPMRIYLQFLGKISSFGVIFFYTLQLQTYVSSYRDSSVQSEASKNVIIIERF